jgi:RimJ/RimL family protein N-acetyltransferase
MAEPPSGSPFVIRELRWEDYPAWRDVYYSLYDEVKENPDLGLTLLTTRPSEAEEVAWFSSLYQRAIRGETIVVIGECDRQPVGMVTIGCAAVGGSASEGGHVGLLGVLVDRRYRGRGLGEAMLVRALELARQRFEIVRLSVFSVNGRAKKLYERLGFRTTGHLERHVKRNGRYLAEDDMALDLRDWKPPAGRAAR